MSESNWTREEIGRIIEEISKRSMTDQEFRERVLSDPNAVIEELAGKPVPDGFKIDIIESKPGVDQTFVLPPLASDTLSDEELDVAAGSRGSSSDSDSDNDSSISLGSASNAF